MSKSLLLTWCSTRPVLILLNGRAPLPNGRNLKHSLESHSSINTSAHHSNLEIDAHDFAPVTNGVAPTQDQDQDQTLKDTQSSLEPSSELPSSGETGDSLLPSSSQSIPDDLNDHLSTKVEEAPVDPPPAVIQQPTSDVREETQPTVVEQVAEMKEQDQQIESSTEMTNGTTPSASHPTTSTGDLQPQTAQPSPPRENQATSMGSSASTESQKIDANNAAESTQSEQTASIPMADIPNHPPVPIPEGTAAEAPLDPAPSPNLPAATSSPKQLPETLQDQPMQDAPPSPPKIAREREDDDVGDEPAAKRSKTDNEASLEFKAPERPAINTQVNGEQPEAAAKESHPITTSQYKALVRTLSNVKRVQASIAFRQPVDVVALKIPTYFNYVTKPMDLRTLEDNLKAGKYPTVDAFVADFNQIVENCRIFNGPEHQITKQASEMKVSFDKQMEKVPGPEVVESSPAEKKKKAILPPPAKVPARRESRSSLPGTARSPVSTASTPTFALNPLGVPSIRRDSTIDGRPKREIHAPSRDLPFGNEKPKKKKYRNELKFCEEVLTEIANKKHSKISWPFMYPVDPVALNIPTYHSVIKKPMDFGTMKAKLSHGEYENAKEFESDAKQVFQNCYKFNRPGDDTFKAGRDLEDVFDAAWARKRHFLETVMHASGAQSPDSSEAEDSDEDEDEDEEDEEATQLSKLQQQIAQMSKQVEMITQQKKSPPVPGKKSAKGAKGARKDSKKSAPPARVKKEAAAKPAKKPPYVTYEQKQDISNRINALSETKMATALGIIRSSMPNLKVRFTCRKIYLYSSTRAILDNEIDTDFPSLKGVQDDELELDIDELSDEVLHKLLVFVRKHVPRAEDSPARPPPTTSSAAPARKKNKPMSKHEQEARIAQVQSGLSAFQNPGSAPVCRFPLCVRQLAGSSLQINIDDDPGPDQESSDGGESSESEEE